MLFCMSWNLYSFPFQNLTAPAEIFPDVACLKPARCHPHLREAACQPNLWHLLMGLFCISHLRSEKLKPNHHHQVGNSNNLLGFWQKECSPPNCLWQQQTKKGVCIPFKEIQFSLIHKGSFLFGMENRKNPYMLRAKKYAKIYRSCLKKLHHSERYALPKDWKGLWLPSLHICRSSFPHTHCPFQLDLWQSTT